MSFAHITLKKNWSPLDQGAVSESTGFSKSLQLLERFTKTQWINTVSAAYKTGLAILSKKTQTAFLTNHNHGTISLVSQSLTENMIDKMYYFYKKRRLII